MTGAQALLAALGAMGVERIFASPGSDWAPLWEALAVPAAGVPEYISSRHEETAVAMAMGYAKATGKLPAVALHTTVGSLHAGMILRAALHERIPMVVLAGESITFGEPPAKKVGHQWLRVLTDMGGPARLMEPCVKWSSALNASALLPHTVQRACQLALSAPRGPVFLSVPIEYLMEEGSFSAPQAALPALPQPAASAIEELASALSSAKRPVIITEEAGRDPAAAAALVALAERLDAPVLEAWQPFYANFPRSHPLYGGVVSDDMPQALKDADFVLLVESVLPWHPPASLPAPGVKVAVLGEDPLHSRLPFWGFRSDFILQGDVTQALRFLVQKITKSQSKSSAWRERNEKQRAARREAARAAGSLGVIGTRWVAHELNSILPENSVVVNETITHRLELIRQLDRLQPGGYFEASYGGLGVGLGLALGIKHAARSRSVIVTIGDGAFHYNPVIASFGAAQEHRLPILVLLFDNAGYLSQKMDVVNYYPTGDAVRTKRFAGTSITPRPDYAALSRAFGGTGERITKPSEVRPALQRGLDAIAECQLALVDVVLESV